MLKYNIHRREYSDIAETESKWSAYEKQKLFKKRTKFWYPKGKTNYCSTIKLGIIKMPYTSHHGSRRAYGNGWETNSTCSDTHSDNKILTQIIRYYSNKTCLHSFHSYCLLDNTYSTLNMARYLRKTSFKIVLTRISFFSGFYLHMYQDSESKV